MSHRRSIRTKSLHVGGSTLLSRLLGLIREYLMVQCLGANALSDIFITAYKIPNSLRKIFAEGALSAAFVPTLVSTVRKDGIKSANALMSFALLFFETIVLILCALIMWKADIVIRYVAGGFSQEKLAQTVPLVQVLMPFIFFVSSSALFAGALQSVGHFFIPAISPVLLNLFFIAGLLLCWLKGVSVMYICFFILAGGAAQLLLHILVYLDLNFSFSFSFAGVWPQLKSVLWKFLICLLGVSVMELSLFIDTSFASYLPDGSISLLYYANRFMSIPLGVFAVTISTILLPHFSGVAHSTPSRLSFYVFEATKLVLFITFPAAFILAFLSGDIFYTIHLITRISATQATEAQMILYAFVLGLPFFSLNKVLLNVYYALHFTTLPTLISMIAILLNVILNIVLMKWINSIGLALATSLSLGIFATALFTLGLFLYVKLKLYPYRFFQFLIYCLIQNGVIFGFGYGAYRLIRICIQLFASEKIAYFLLQHIGFWLWAGPLCLIVFGLVLITRKRFKVPVYFLD